MKTIISAALTGAISPKAKNPNIPCTPKEIADLLYREIVKIVHEPDVKEKFAALGFDAVANTPEEFAAQIKSEITKWGKVIKDANIKVD